MTAFRYFQRRPITTRPQMELMSRDICARPASFFWCLPFCTIFPFPRICYLVTVYCNSSNNNNRFSKYEPHRFPQGICTLPLTRMNSQPTDTTFVLCCATLRLSHHPFNCTSVFLLTRLVISRQPTPDRNVRSLDTNATLLCLHFPTPLFISFRVIEQMWRRLKANSTKVPHLGSIVILILHQPQFQDVVKSIFYHHTTPIPTSQYGMYWKCEKRDWFYSVLYFQIQIDISDTRFIWLLFLNSRNLITEDTYSTLVQLPFSTVTTDSSIEMSIEKNYVYGSGSSRLFVLA